MPCIVGMLFWSRVSRFVTYTIFWSCTATRIRLYLTKFPSYRAVGGKFHLREWKWKLLSHQRRNNFIEQRSVGRIPWLPYELCERVNRVACFLRQTCFFRGIYQQRHCVRLLWYSLHQRLWCAATFSFPMRVDSYGYGMYESGSRLPTGARKFSFLLRSRLLWGPPSPLFNGYSG